MRSPSGGLSLQRCRIEYPLMHAMRLVAEFALRWTGMCLPEAHMVKRQVAQLMMSALRSTVGLDGWSPVGNDLVPERPEDWAT